ncbi:hypothetical protein ATCC90586_009465 [Pythium insidiosum]|nr:hypothetical protein ATCC90586_009465 [Pythium insidiosum]
MPKDGLNADQPAPTAEPQPAPLPRGLLAMAQRPPLHCVFYYESQTVTSEVNMPLVYAKADDASPGTRLMDLEVRLREHFRIPVGSSVFAVVPAEELYSPAYPLVMINTIAANLYQRYENDRVPVLHFAIVVRDMTLLRQPMPRNEAHESPFFPISAALLSQREPSVARQLARMRFVQNMQRFGFVRLEVTSEQAQIPQHAFEAVRKWLQRQRELPADKRWSDKVDGRSDAEATSSDDGATHPLVSRGRYVGFRSDRNREYLQLRRPIAASGTVWPPAYFADNQAFAMEMLALLNLLDDLGRDCMRAICDVLNMDVNWVMNELLDDPTAPPATAAEVAQVDKSYQYGASVLRVYNYRNKAKGNGDKTPINPEDDSCGVHADLGLVTVSPCATVPGLQMWNMERMSWTDVEADAGVLHFSVFAGETLGFITNGLIKAPLHRVPPICVDSEADRRMSMPYFLRARPNACLNPRAEPNIRLTCRDFMEDVVFKKRPWRRDTPDSPPPDY